MDSAAIRSKSHFLGHSAAVRRALRGLGLPTSRIYVARGRPSGSGLRSIGRRPPVLAACIDQPRERDVASHNHRVCRFSGWAASMRGRPVRIAVRGLNEPLELEPSVPRPDVVATFGRSHGVAEERCGFQFYVDVPPIEGDHVAVELEFTDGEVAVRSEPFRLLRDVDPSALDTYVGDGYSKRRLAAERLAGNGLELGALHQPLQVDPSRCRMSYGDRWTKAEAIELFPELRPFAGQMVEPELILDLATGELGKLDVGDVDFIVANDVIEHLPNPIRFLRDAAEIMRPGALLFTSVPDRDYTFDSRRALTPLPHLWSDFENDVTDVEDEHLRDYLVNAAEIELPRDPAELAGLYAHHRQRSIHVHVWDQDSFDGFLEDVIARLSLDLAPSDRIPSREADGSMVYVFEKRPS